MKDDGNDRIIYSINVRDIQEVANQVLEQCIPLLPTACHPVLRQRIRQIRHAAIFY